MGAHDCRRSVCPVDNGTVTEEREVLSLVCPQCEESFPSAMQMDPATFEKIRMDRMLEHCTSCGHAAYFSKPEYRFLPA